MRPLSIAGVVVILALCGSGCSWFRDKPSPPAEAVAGAADAAAADAAVSAPAGSAGSQDVPEAEPAQGPVAVAMDFLVMHRRLGSSGLPQRGDMAAYDAFLCPELAQAVRAAQVRQEQSRAEHPQDKPPYVDGDLFSSLFEGAEGFEARDTAMEADQARVAVAMSHGEGEAAQRWKDTLVMRLDDGIWCLADVEYGGDWPFANQGRLSTLLSP